MGLAFCKNSRLSVFDVDFGAFEILWRLLPPLTVYVPLNFLNLVALSAEKGELTSEETKMLEQIKQLASRAELLLLPVFAKNHYTLLALQRTCPDAPAVPQAAPTAEAGAVTGCANCKYTSCAACSVPAAQAGERRVAETFLVCDQMSRPPLANCSGWTPRYFDTLVQPHRKCKEQAERILKLLDYPGPVPQRENKVRQGNHTSCGYYCLHYMEEMCRRKLGLGSYLVQPDIEARAGRIQKLKDHVLTKLH